MIIDLLGASFNPPHKGHKEIVSAILSQKVAEEVWLVPASQHAFGKSLTEAHHRLAMLQLFLEDLKDQPVKVEKCELEREGPSYSYDTLTQLSSARPLDAFAWVIGSDNLANFHKWYNYLALLQKFSVHVYPRPSYPMSPLLSGMVPLQGVKEVALSSTDVRTKTQAGEDITNLVGAAIAAYITQNHLYR